MSAPANLIKGVKLFSDLEDREVSEIAQTFRERSFPAGEVIAEEGQRGIGFFVIAAGTAKVTSGGEDRVMLGPGDYFGEIALIDDGPRTATVTADTDLQCYGITSWEFKPIVESNAEIAWKLLVGLAKRVRALEGR